MEGWAERIEYDGKQEVSKLIRRARMARLEGSTVSHEIRGALITYDSRNAFTRPRVAMARPPAPRRLPAVAAGPRRPGPARLERRQHTGLERRVGRDAAACTAARPATLIPPLIVPAPTPRTHDDRYRPLHACRRLRLQHAGSPAFAEALWHAHRGARCVAGCEERRSGRPAGAERWARRLRST